MRVAWFSSGCSSFVAAYYGKPDRIGRKKHLCKDCAKSFREWFNAPKSSETTAKLLRNEVRNSQA